MVTKTHLFFEDEEFTKPTELKKGDRIVFGGGFYTVLRDERHLYCKAAGAEGATKFTMGNQPHAVHGLLDLADMYKVPTHIVPPGEKLHGGEYEWSVG